MDKITIDIESSLFQRMSQFDCDWSLFCKQAIESKLQRLNTQSNGEDLKELIDIDITYNSSELAKFDIPVFPRQVYKLFKEVWVENFHSFYPEKKPPTSNQIKQLWQTWYSPFFDDAEWWENWENNREQEIEKSVAQAYSQKTQYTEIEAQKEFLLYFAEQSMDVYGLNPLYTAFIEFVSKFIFRGELIDFNSLTPFQLDSIDIENKDDLPEQSGIYFVIDQSDIYYIGMSLNIQKRWYNHHKQQALNSLPSIRIAYLDCLPKHYLKNIESALIEHFKPKLNIVGNPLYRTNKQ